jgi:hypothetical protein
MRRQLLVKIAHSGFFVFASVLILVLVWGSLPLGRKAMCDSADPSTAWCLVMDLKRRLLRRRDVSEVDAVDGFSTGT